MGDIMSAYPYNALSDMGFSAEDIDKYALCLLSDFYGLIWKGLFTSSRYRIFRRYYIDGYSPQDISSAMGLSLNHVKRELSRIKHTLRRNATKAVPDTITDYSNELPIDPEDTKDNILSVVKNNPYLLDIDDLGLSVRSHMILRRSGIQTLGDIRDLGLEGLRSLRNKGSNSINEILAVLKEYDISL